MVRFILCIFFSFASLLSCGKQHFPDYEDHSSFIHEKQEEGIFRGKFGFVNSHLSGRVNARYVLWIKDIQFYARVVFGNGQGRVRYQQFIHKGARCPQMSDDLNGDNIIDFSEVLKISGETFIPLDGTLDSQWEGNDWFPVATRAGKYTYIRSTAIFKIMKDLRERDSDPADSLVKLKPQENLDLVNRTILLYGTSTDPLLPVACAEIERD